MTISSFAASAPVRPGNANAAVYRPGTCNIGPAEIARRRQFGHLGVIVTGILLVVLVLVHAPAPLRLLAIIPAAGAATGYLQAWLRFCAGFGARGVFNFGEIGETEAVDDPEARARDRARATQIGLASLAIGIVVGVAAFLLPI